MDTGKGNIDVSCFGLLRHLVTGLLNIKMLLKYLTK